MSSNFLTQIRIRMNLFWIYSLDPDPHETNAESETLDITQAEIPLLAVTYLKKQIDSTRQEMSGTNRAHLLTSRKPVVFKSDSFFQDFVVRLSFSAPFPPRLEEGD